MHFLFSLTPFPAISNFWHPLHRLDYEIIIIEYFYSIFIRYDADIIQYIHIFINIEGPLLF